MTADFTPEQITLHDRQRDLGEAGQLELVGWLRTEFPPGGLVLDAGAGSGGAVRTLLAAGLRTILLDVSTAMLAAAAERGAPRVRADLCALPLSDGAVDGVHAAFVLQNIPTWRTAVAELARVVRPGGAIVVAWGNAVVDPVVAAARRRLAEEFARSGADVGVAANATGLNEVSDGHAAFAAAAFDVVREQIIAGQQQRSLRQLVAQAASNPFMWRATPERRAEARDRTLRWAGQELGRINDPRSVPVSLRLHSYRRAEGTSSAPRPSD